MCWLPKVVVQLQSFHSEGCRGPAANRCLADSKSCFASAGACRAASCCAAADCRCPHACTVSSAARSAPGQGRSQAAGRSLLVLPARTSFLPPDGAFGCGDHAASMLQLSTCKSSRLVQGPWRNAELLCPSRCDTLASSGCVCRKAPRSTACAGSLTMSCAPCCRVTTAMTGFTMTALGCSLLVTMRMMMRWLQKSTAVPSVAYRYTSPFCCISLASRIALLETHWQDA